jgi:hypothetical protein
MTEGNVVNRSIGDQLIKVEECLACGAEWQLGTENMLADNADSSGDGDAEMMSRTDRTPFDGCPECGGSLACPSRSDRICQDCGEEYSHETRGDRHLLWSVDEDYQLNEVVAYVE